MPHIHTDAGQHDLTTTAFILRIDTPQPVGFLHVHKKLGLLLPAGGHVELTETPWAAVLHEIEEETGYDLSQLEVLQPRERIVKMDGVKNHPVPLFLQTHMFKDSMDHRHTDIGFLFVASEPPMGLPHEGESSETLWLTKDQIQERKEEMPPDIAQIYDFCFSTALPSWQRMKIGAFDA